MATTVSYAASMVTRKYTSSSNAKSSVASQEFYDSSYNCILCFSGMNLANKVITSIWLDIDAAKAGYGAGSSKLAFLRKANYQNSIASGVAGWEYVGDELGTFEGSFYGNSTSYYITGDLFNQMAAYIAQATTASPCITLTPAHLPTDIPITTSSGKVALSPSPMRKRSASRLFHPHR